MARDSSDSFEWKPGVRVDTPLVHSRCNDLPSKVSEPLTLSLTLLAVAVVGDLFGQ